MTTPKFGRVRAGKAISKRRSFGKLVHLLRLLNASRRVHIPVVSNAYHTESIEELEAMMPSGMKGYRIT